MPKILLNFTKSSLASTNSSSTLALLSPTMPDSSSSPALINPVLAKSSPMLALSSSTWAKLSPATASSSPYLENSSPTLSKYQITDINTGRKAIINSFIINP
jgi:hypothetical protein